MAKKKTTKKPSRAKAAKKTARTAKAGAKRKSKATPAPKKRTTAKKSTKKPKASSKKSAKKSVKKAATPKKAAKKKTVKKKAVAVAKTSGKEAAKKPKKKVAKPKAAPKPPPTPAPIYSSSVIRIKMNPDAKRRPSRSRKSKETLSPEATAHDPIQYPEESRRTPKTYLSAKELREFKKLLLKKRSELCGDVERLTAEAFRKGGDGGSDRSNMPIHMADLGTDNWEQDFTIDLIDNERSRVIQIDDALTRIDKKTYGICVATHNKISHARLRAKPWAKYCIEFARAREEGRAY